MEKLIEMVRGYPILYDTGHEDYMRTKQKDELWEKIAKELNYADAKAAKEQWRKLRECHREALRRQQKKSGQEATNSRPWTYQKQMEFLKPFMKNRNTVGYPTSSLEDSRLEEDDITLSDSPSVKETNRGEPIEPSESVTRKKFKQSTITDPVIRKFIEDSDKRAKKRDELRQNLVAEKQKREDLQNDALYQFFMSMFNITKDLPVKYQKQVRRKLFQVVSEAEDKAENETDAKGETEQNLQMNSQCSLSSATHPISAFSSGMTQGFPEFFSASNSPSVSSIDTNERSCSRQEEDDYPRTFFNM